MRQDQITCDEMTGEMIHVSSSVIWRAVILSLRWFDVIVSHLITRQVWYGGMVRYHVPVVPSLLIDGAVSGCGSISSHLNSTVLSAGGAVATSSYLVLFHLVSHDCCAKMRWEWILHHTTLLPMRCGDTTLQCTALHHR